MNECFELIIIKQVPSKHLIDIAELIDWSLITVWNSLKIYKKKRWDPLCLAQNYNEL